MALNNHVENFTLDMAPGGIAPVLNVSQGDTGRAYTADMYWGGASYDVSGLTVRLRGRKRDNTVFDYALPAPSGTKVSFDLQDKEQVTIIPGNVECELVFTDSDSRVVGTANFVIIVEEAPFDPDALSESDVEGLSEMVAEQVSETIDEDISAALAPVLTRLTAVEGKATSNETKNTQQDTEIETLTRRVGALEEALPALDEVLTEKIDDLETRLKSGAVADADLHLGFYLDNDDDLCQVD